MKIKLLTQDAIKNELKEVAKDAKIIQGTVAYWTWDIDYTKENFGTNFQNVLKKPNSFYCVDINSTITNINNIDKYYKEKCNFYVYRYKLDGNKSNDEKSIYLLHSKMLYIKTTKKHFVFIGSHNNTKHAFDKINMEHSILLEFPLDLPQKDQDLLDDILLQLKEIKKHCVPYDPKLKDYYTRIKVDNNSYSRIVLEMENKHLKLVKNGDLISIISYHLFQKSNSSEFKIIGEKFIIKIIDENDKKYFYALCKEVAVVEKGKMDRKATESDFITIRIPDMQDPLGLPYLTIKTDKNQVWYGKQLNFSDHIIYRFQILEEIKPPNSVIEIEEHRKKMIFGYQ